MWNTNGPSVLPGEVVTEQGADIHFAGEPWVSQPWRLYERGNRWVSRR